MAHMQVLTGPELGTRVDITTGKFTVGRARNNSLVLADPSISSRHCVIEKTAEGFYKLKDLNSTNGTRVNEDRIQEKELAAKDILKFGSVELIFDGDDVILNSTARSTPPVTVIVEEVTTDPLTATAPPDFGEKVRSRSPGWWIPLALGAVIIIGFMCFFIAALL